MFPVGPGITSRSECNWAMFAHLGGFLLSGLVPLVVYLYFRKRSRYVADQACEALNFQITLLMGYVAAAVLVFALIGLVLLPLIALISLASTVVAALASNRREPYRYPFCLRIVKCG